MSLGIIKWSQNPVNLARHRVWRKGETASLSLSKTLTNLQVIPCLFNSVCLSLKTIGSFMWSYRLSKGTCKLRVLLKT